MKMILLTAEQTEQVRGKYGEFDELQPIISEYNGETTYWLPSNLIDVSIFSSVSEFLKTCEQKELNIEDKYFKDGVEIIPTMLEQMSKQQSRKGMLQEGETRIVPEGLVDESPKYFDVDGIELSIFDMEYKRILL